VLREIHDLPACRDHHGTIGEVQLVVIRKLAEIDDVRRQTFAISAGLACASGAINNAASARHRISRRRTRARAA
jgi:hypothetical protein